MKRWVWIYLLAVLLPVLTLAALALRAARRERAFLERQLEESARAQAAVVVSDAEAELAEMRQEFAAIYREVDFASADTPTVEKACREFQERHAFARLIFVLDADGTILLTAAPQTTGEPTLVAGRAGLRVGGVVSLDNRSILTNSGGNTVLRDERSNLKTEAVFANRVGSDLYAVPPQVLSSGTSADGSMAQDDDAYTPSSGEEQLKRALRAATLTVGSSRAADSLRSTNGAAEGSGTIAVPAERGLEETRVPTPPPAAPRLNYRAEGRQDSLGAKGVVLTPPRPAAQSLEVAQLPQQQAAQLTVESDAESKFRQQQQSFFYNTGTVYAYTRNAPATKMSGELFYKQKSTKVAPANARERAAAAQPPIADLKDAEPQKEAEVYARADKKSDEQALLSNAQSAPLSAPLASRAPATEKPADAAMEDSDDWASRSSLAPLARGYLEKSLAIPVVSKLQEQLSRVSGLNQQVVAVPANFRDLLALGQFYLPRIMDNQLSLLLCVREPSVTNRIAGCEVDLAELKARLQRRFEARQWPADVCAAVLDDRIRPVALSQEDFTTDFRRPLVSEPLSEALPHWEAAIYLTKPGQLAATARWTASTIALSVITCIAAIFVGTVLVWQEATRERRLAQQKADFVTNITHELQTPLANIRLFSEMLGNGTAPPEKARQYSDVLVAETERLSRLINNVLDFSRDEKQRQRTYQMEPTDACALVREIVEMQRPRLENGGFKLATRIPDSPLMIKADCESVTRALLNLLSNAEKYGGDAREIEVSVSATAGKVEIALADRGVGVPAKEREKIFEPFYRVNDRLNSGATGTGLGLTLARRTARDHGGDLWYEPREGGGSVFVLTLPLS